MQRGLFAQPNAVEEQNPLEQLIKNVFYNALVNYVFDHGKFNRDTLPQKLKEGIAATIRGIVEASDIKVDGIRLPTGKIINMQNCPDRYKPLFATLLQLKTKQSTDAEYAVIAGRIMALPTFQTINPTQFLLEAIGEIVPEQSVTPALIRNTFYNEMVTQALLAIEYGWLTLQDIEDEEPKVYLALPALTILEAIQQSQHCDGIRLLEGKFVNTGNCPQAENFPELIAIILSVKGKIKSMTEKEILAVKQILTCDADLPANLQPLKTHDLMTSVAVIKNMSIEISRRKVFNEMIGIVLERCLETLKPQPQGMKHGVSH